MSEIYTDPPQSRNEAIIKATIDGTEYTAPPQSRMEDLLLELKEAIEQGGGGGTSDYSQLTNKPSINDVELSGNKTASDLGLMPAYEVDTTPTEDSDNLISSKAVYEADEEIKDELEGSKTVSGNPITITDAEPMNAESVKVELEPKQDLHGYDKPWAGGASKNLLPMTVDGIKALNTTGTWSGNTYSINNGSLTIQSDSAGNVTGITANGTFNPYVWNFVIGEVPIQNNIRLVGCPSNGDFENKFALYVFDSGARLWDDGEGVNFDNSSVNATVNIVIRDNVQMTNEIFKPMITTDLTATYSTFTPYSNICPITGYSEVNVERDGNTYTIDLDGTKYGGILNVIEGGYSDEWGYISGSSVSDLQTWATSAGVTFRTSTTDDGNLRVEFAEIAEPVSSDTDVPSYNALRCNELNNVSDSSMYWDPISGVTIQDDGDVRFAVNGITTQADMDTWLSNNPIQIAYRKKTPSSVSTTPTDIPLLENTNNISTDGTNITLKYQPNNVIGECKAYTDEQVQKVLPTPPTTDGTYHLECSVSGGIPTITWVLNS